MSFSDPPPDPTNPDLLNNLRDYLIGLGLVRDPRDGTNPNLPPMWRFPRFGIPAPGQKEDLRPVEQSTDMHVALNYATDIPPARYEGFLRNQHVEIVYRARIPPLALSLENKIRAALNDKRGWMMGLVPVNESLLFRGLQPVSSDNTGFLFTQEYQFVLWGPFTPVGP